MELATIPERYRLMVAMRLGIVLVILLLVAVSPVDAERPVPHDVVFLIDNSPSVRTGEGAPDGEPTDPALVRLRLSRFVVNVLGLDPASASQRVGVISFARITQMLMPLTPVRDWSKADFAAIHEVDQGSGTDFAAALSAASEMLFPPGAPDCSPGVRRCDVVVVTDGFFDNIARDRPAAETRLQDFHSRGVSVHLLTFGVGHQDVWQELLAATLISTYRPSVTLASPARVYGTVLRGLGAEALLAGLTPVEVVGEQTIALTIPPFRTWTRYQILPDSPLTVTFLHMGQVMTPVVAGTEYTFFQPQAGNWSVQLQGDGLAYYQQAGEGIADLSLYLRAPEEVLALGDDVVVRAGLTAGGAPVTDLTPFAVTATISGTAGITGPLRLEPDETVGLFATTVPSGWFESGVYTMALAAESNVPGVEIRPVEQQFEVFALPTPAVTVTPTEPVRLGKMVVPLGLTLVVALMALMILTWRWWQHKKGLENIRRGFKKDPGDPKLWRKWDGLSMENSWPIIEELGKQLAEDWRLMRWALNRKEEEDGKGKSALLEVFNRMREWEALSSRLGKCDEKALAVLICGGIVASTELAWDQSQRDGSPLPNPISPLEALEGTGNRNKGEFPCPERPSCIRESLSEATGQVVFLEVFGFVEGKYEEAIKQLQENQRLSVWRNYSVLVKYAYASDQENVESVREALKYLIEAVNEDTELSKLLNDVVDKMGSCGSIAGLDTHPLLQRVCKKLRGEA